MCTEWSYPGFCHFKCFVVVVVVVVVGGGGGGGGVLGGVNTLDHKSI